MAEIGIIASIIGVAGAGFRLSLVLNAVATQISNAECDVHNIAKGISLFSLMLKQVGKTMEEGRTVATQSALDTATEIRDQSQVVFDEIKNMVDLAQAKDENGHIRSITIAQRVKWCFKKQKVQYLLGQLESLKLSLSIMLQILQMGKAIVATRDDPLGAPLTEHTMRQDRAEIQNMIVVQHWSLVELRKLYELAEKEAKEEMMSPTIEDPPPSYDAAGNAQTTSYYEEQAANEHRRLSIQGPAVPDKIPNDSQAMVRFEEKPLQQLDRQFTLALSQENRALSAPVDDIVNHLLQEWTKIPEAEARPSPPNSRGHPSPPSSRKNSTANPSGKPTYLESDEDTSDSEFERSVDIGGRFIEAPRRGVEKNVRFRARVESDEEEQAHHQSRRRAPKKHILHSEDDTSSDTESDVSPPPRGPGSRRSSDGSNMSYSRDGPDRRPRPYLGRTNGPEDAGRLSARGMGQQSIPQGRPMLHQPHGRPTPPISTGFRNQQPYGPLGGPPRMPNGSPYISAGYMGQSPQPPSGNYFPQQQQRPPGPSMPPRQQSHRDREHRRSAERDATSASRNLRRGLFGGAAVAGILDLLSGLDGQHPRASASSPIVQPPHQAINLLVLSYQSHQSSEVHLHVPRDQILHYVAAIKSERIKKSHPRVRIATNLQLSQRTLTDSTGLGTSMDMESSGGLRRRDTTKGTPLRILSLDGGGVRGYSMLILLHDFMHKTYAECNNGEPPEADKVPKPCDYFDLIAGTGTGGLIAIMLGRLRMNTKDCMRVYVQMTRKVFETDKTIAGIPYRSTLFKASMLEDAIRACVRTFEHERDENPEDVYGDMPNSPASYSRPPSMMSDKNGMPRSSTSSSPRNRYSQFSADNWTAMGDPNAALEDPRREKRCKTAVTAVLKGHNERSATAVLLRSYPSRTQPAIESECAIWQAGRATSATKLAFKEIRIGTSTFLDEGYGLVNSDKTPTYNPAPQILDEALINEWPGQTIGLFLSIGTGKRPGGTSNMQSEWWEGFAGGLGSFAEAKRKLIAKIEGCEKTHQEMMSIHLPKRGVAPHHYLRLNVEVGVGEFGMNEWNRLADISNSTQSYLNQPAVRVMLNEGAQEMAKVEAMRRHAASRVQRANETFDKHAPAYVPPSEPSAIELPSGEDPPLMPRPLSKPGPIYPGGRPHSYQQASSPDEKFTTTSSDEFPQPADVAQQRYSEERPHQSSNEYQRPDSGYEAPPLPPKTPIPYRDAHAARRHVSYPRGNGNAHPPLPYPDTDGPPPVVNMARKPEQVPR